MARSKPRLSSVRVALRLRGFAARTLIGAMPPLPRVAVAEAVRFEAIRRTRLAPLHVTIAPGDTVVQVGAVETGELWEMVRLVGKRGRVIVVEPFLESVRGIEARLKAKGIANVTVVPKGAWSEHGMQHLFVHPRFAGSNIILESGAAH